MGGRKLTHDSSSTVIELIGQSDHRVVTVTRDRSPGVPGSFVDARLRGIWIDAPPSAVWPWLVQMGQDRAGFYASPGRQNADGIHPEWQHLAVGDTVRLTPRDWVGRPDGLVLSVVEVIEQQAIILRTNRGGNWDATCTLHLAPHWQDRCRLLVRTHIRLAHTGAVMITELVPVHDCA